MKLGILSRQLSIQRFVRSCSSQYPKCDLVAQKLANRCLLRLGGVNVSDYLQGLITNDINHLESGTKCVYAMFLNTKGRVLYDSIIYKSDKENEYLIECDTNVSSDLVKLLNLYKVRRKISVELTNNEYEVWNINHGNCLSSTVTNKLDFKQVILDLKLPCTHIVQDPRVPLLGLRAISPSGVNIAKHIQQNEQSADYYVRLRYKLGVPEGPSEIPIGNCFPLEYNCDYMHGVSFHKGCYIGQELTARTHHTGVIRKRIMPLLFDEDLPPMESDTVVTAEGNDKTLGKVRGTKGKYGIGLLRIEEVLKSSHLLAGTHKFQTQRPSWWPSEAPKDRFLHTT